MNPTIQYEVKSLTFGRLRLSKSIHIIYLRRVKRRFLFSRMAVFAVFSIDRRTRFSYSLQSAIKEANS